MKLSEAILLGSSVLKAKPGKIHDLQESGCALGMAGVANGCTFGPPVMGDAPEREGHIERVPGWEWTTQIVRRPCHCIFVRFFWVEPISRIFLPRYMPAKQVVTHLFDRHVFGRRNWTLDELVEFVRSVEPEPSPESVVHCEMKMVSPASGLLRGLLQGVGTQRADD